MKKLAALAVASLFLAGCGLVLSREDLEARYGSNPPSITSIHVADYFPPPRPPRVYIQGEDPDGDIAVINYVIDPGGPHQVSYGAVFVVGRQSRALSGYLWLAADYFDYFLRVRQREFSGSIYLEDRAGHLSKPVRFTIRTYGLGPLRAEKPGEIARYKKNPLGPIRFELDRAKE